MLQCLPLKCEVLVPTSGKQKKQRERCREDESLSSGPQHPHKKAEVAMHACMQSQHWREDKEGKVEFVIHHPSSRFGKEPVSKSNMESDGGKRPDAELWSPHTSAHGNTHTHMHTHKR